jgi:hypothetical protein
MELIHVAFWTEPNSTDASRTKLRGANSHDFTSLPNSEEE